MTDHPTVSRRDWLLMAAPVLVGVVLRTLLWLRSDPLWLDEACLAFNLYRSPWNLFTRPLDWSQVCAPGFLALLKLQTALFGFNDHVLRLVPLVGSIIGLIVAQLAAWRLLTDPRKVALFGLLAATSFMGLKYSSELKPYSSEFGVGALVVLAVLAPPRGGAAWLRWALPAMLFVLPFFSLFSVFVFASAALARVILERRVDRQLILHGVSYGLGFLVSYVIVKGQLSPAGTAFMQQYWLKGFPHPALLETRRALIFYLIQPIRVLTYYDSLGTMTGGALVALGVVGSLWRARGRQDSARPAAMLALTLTLVVLCLHGVAAVRIYPLEARIQFGLLPLMMLLMTLGCFHLVDFLPRRAMPLAVLIVVALLLPWGHRTWQVTKHLPSSTARAMEILANDRDPIYLTGPSAATVLYYARQRGIPPERFVVESGPLFDDTAKGGPVYDHRIVASGPSRALPWSKRRPEDAAVLRSELARMGNPRRFLLVSANYTGQLRGEDMIRIFDELTGYKKTQLTGQWGLYVFEMSRDGELPPR